MCVQNKVIKNPYTERFLTVRCNHCPACMQENANKRANRIRNTKVPDKEPWYHVFFVTLTYKNEYLPYIELDDLINLYKNNNYIVPVYRDREVRYVTKNYKDHISVVKHLVRKNGILPERHIIRLIHKENMKRNGVSFDFRRWHKEKDPFPHNAPRTIISHPALLYRESVVLEQHKNRIPVINFRDLQLFQKRVRDYFTRNGINKFHYFMSAEYGAETLRPHAHVVFFVPKGYKQLAKRLLSKAWPFDSDLPRKIEDERKDVAKYAASYVNKSGDVPYFLQNVSSIAPKSSFSYGLGFGKNEFTFDKILEAYQQRNFSYDFPGVDENGIKISVSAMFPKYVISRYFPKFKGFGRFTPDEIRNIAYCPEKYAAVCYEYAQRDKLFTYDPEVIRRTIVILKGKQKLFLRKSKFVANTFLEQPTKTLLDFAEMYSNVWTIYTSNCLKNVYLKCDSDEKITEHFDIHLSPAIYPGFYSFDEYMKIPFEQKSWNTHPLNVKRTQDLERKYKESSFIHKRNNSVNNRFIYV